MGLFRPDKCHPSEPFHFVNKKEKEALENESWKTLFFFRLYAKTGEMKALI